MHGARPLSRTCRIVSLVGLGLLASLRSCQGILLNSTLDDTFPDPVTGAKIVYAPAGAWNNGRDCSRCTARPNEANLYNKTWHDNTFYGQNTPPTASVTFNGTAIYVYCVLAQSTSKPTGYSDMTFTLDGEVVGTFVKSPPGIPGYDYDMIVDRNTSLANKHHEFMLQNGHVNGSKAIVLLDRIVYTYDDGTQSQPQSRSRVGAIVGGTLGGLAGLALIAIVIVYWQLKRRQQQRPQSLVPPSHQPHLTSFPFTVSDGPSHGRDASDPLNPSMAVYGTQLSSLKLGSARRGPLPSDTTSSSINAPQDNSTRAYEPYDPYDVNHQLHTARSFLVHASQSQLPSTFDAGGDVPPTYDDATAPRASFVDRKGGR